MYAFTSAILFVLAAVNAGSWVLCRLMQSRISAAEARLAGGSRATAGGEAEVGLELEEGGGGFESGGTTPAATPTSGSFFGGAGVGTQKVTRRELVRMTKVVLDNQGVDGTVKERAEAVLAMKKALFDLRVISSVVGLTVIAQFIMFIYVLVFVAKNWLLTKPFK